GAWQVAGAVADVGLIHRSKGRTGQRAVGLRLVEIELVGHVENLGAELHAGALGDVRGLVQRYVRIGRAHSPDLPGVSRLGSRRKQRLGQEVVARATGIGAEGLHGDAAIGIPLGNAWLHHFYGGRIPVDVRNLGLRDVNEVARQSPRDP